MSEARVPDDKSEHNAIDIFLFSNGQQYSPPRKYHLASDQLDWWKATLSYLAKAQYGSLHNMVNLYTIDGQKIETAFELSHNTAYVAVEPQDTFIGAGYDKYLIKATRSWEKSQNRRSSNTTMDKPEEPLNLKCKSNSNNKVYDIINTRKPREESVTLETIIPSMVENQASLIVKPECAKHVYNNNNNKKTPVKQSSKISRQPIQRPPIVKKNNPPSSPLRTRKPSIKIRDCVKINTETTNSRLPDANNIKDSSNSKIQNNKPVQKQRESLFETVLAKVEEVVYEAKPSSSLKLDNNKNSSSKTCEPQNVVQGMEMISESNTYKYPTEDTRISIVMNPGTLPLDIINRHGHEHLDENSQCIKSTNDNFRIEDYIEPVIILTKNNNTHSPLMEHELNSPVASKVSKPEHDVVTVNKEGTVNLKLNIKIWNGSNGTKDTSNNAFKKGLLIILNHEKGSKVVHEVKYLDSEQLHKIAPDVKGYGENHNGIIVQCSCHKDCTDNANNKMVHVIDSNCKFLIFLPVSKLDEAEDTKRCFCKENKGSNPITDNSSELYVAKKVISFLSLQMEEVVSYSEITTMSNLTEVKEEASPIQDNHDWTMPRRKSAAIKKDQVTFPEGIIQYEAETGKEEEHLEVSTPSELEKSESIVINKELQGISLKADKFTQTEWCDVLLEVKLQNDGHYSFHMPPLSLLNEYKL